MSALLAALMLASQPAAPMPEHVLRFHYYRLVFFQKRARQLNCDSDDLDTRLEKIRRRLNKRFGKDSFRPSDDPPDGFGDCSVILNVYRRNLEIFSRDAETALDAPRPAEPAGRGS